MSNLSFIKRNISRKLYAIRNSLLTLDWNDGKRMIATCDFKYVANGYNQVVKSDEFEFVISGEYKALKLKDIPYGISFFRLPDFKNENYVKVYFVLFKGHKINILDAEIKQLMDDTMNEVRKCA